MAFIYQIVNDINDKVYVGKTEFSIERRFQEHCRDCKKEHCKNRPLYRAMNKYGIEHFHIELLEETDNPEEREEFWIKEKGSYKYGYNATMGGDGKKYLDYDLIVNVYKEVKSIIETAKICGCNEDSVSYVLRSKKVKVLTSQQVNLEKYGNVINQYDLKGNYIKTFESARQAAKELRPNVKSQGGVVTHITEVCKGKRKTAYGYIWKYAKNLD